MIAGLGIGLIVVAAVAGAGIICSGLTGNMAKSAESMNPTGKVNGNALVVYDPGVTGAARKAATEIANDLKSKGYKVELAGVSSSTVTNVSKYDLIIVGGPMYFGKVSNSIDKYLKTLTLPKDVKLGVFGTTGAAEFNKEDIEGLSKQVTSLQSNNTAIKTLRNGDATSIDCINFVSAALG